MIWGHSWGTHRKRIDSKHSPVTLRTTQWWRHPWFLTMTSLWAKFLNINNLSTRIKHGAFIRLNLYKKGKSRGLALSIPNNLHYGHNAGLFVYLRANPLCYFWHKFKPLGKAGWAWCLIFVSHPPYIYVTCIADQHFGSCMYCSLYGSC